MLSVALGEGSMGATGTFLARGRSVGTVLMRICRWRKLLVAFFDHDSTDIETSIALGKANGLVIQRQS